MSWLGIDAGTSSIKALLINDAQQVLAEGSAPLDVQRPRPLWSEQDPAAWWQATEAAIAQVRAAAPDAWAGLDGIGLSGQQHGAVAGNRAHGAERVHLLRAGGARHQLHGQRRRARLRQGQHSLRVVQRAQKAGDHAAGAQPLQLVRAREQGRLGPGDVVVLVGLAGGISIGAMAVRM